MATYEETAQSIIKEAIKSAIFIDENAKEPFMQEEAAESKRSEDLYKNFKENAISLSIYKYDETTYPGYKNYLFHNRDLVLLDWKLDGEDGEDKSLALLSEVVNMQPHIHFCVIYTSEKPDIVFNNILSYFSCLTKDEYEEILEDFEDEKEIIDKMVPDLISLSQNRFSKAQRSDILKSILSNKELITRVKSNPLLQKEETGEKSLGLLCGYIRLGIAFSPYIKADSMQPCPSDINAEQNTLCINNTLITVFNKDDIEANQILEVFSQQITNYEKGVMHLLGLEMRNMQRKGGTFIDSAVLSVSKEALGYHKQQSGKGFSSFVKNVMVEHLKTNIRNAELSILDAIQPCAYQDEPDKKKEYAAMNVFYNSQRKIGNDKILSFGDVFKYEDKFYICITALCDCTHPEKRDNCYYFAEGQKLVIEKALEKGDSGYISYISPDCCIKWDKDALQGEYSHIVPVNYFVENNHIINNKLSISRFRNKVVEVCEFEYITTIRQNYTQRIANFAFSHPVRVGIDFVKKP